MPSILVIAWRLFQSFGKKIGEFNSRIILTVVYYAGNIIPVLIGKLLRKQFLQEKLQHASQSYWEEHQPITIDDFKRSF